MNKPQTVITNAVILSNAADLVSNVLIGIAGNDIADSINGSKATRDQINLLVINRLRSNITGVK